MFDEWSSGFGWGGDVKTLRFFLGWDESGGGEVFGDEVFGDGVADVSFGGLGNLLEEVFGVVEVAGVVPVRG